MWREAKSLEQHNPFTKELFSLDLRFLEKHKNKNESDSRPILSSIGVDGGRGQDILLFPGDLGVGLHCFWDSLEGCGQKEPWLDCRRGAEDGSDQITVSRPD